MICARLLLSRRRGGYQPPGSTRKRKTKGPAKSQLEPRRCTILFFPQRGRMSAKLTGEGEKSGSSAIVSASPSSVIRLAGIGGCHLTSLRYPENTSGLRESLCFPTAAQKTSSLFLPPAARGCFFPAGGRLRRAADSRPYDGTGPRPPHFSLPSSLVTLSAVLGTAFFLLFDTFWLSQTLYRQNGKCFSRCRGAICVLYWSQIPVNTKGVCHDLRHHPASL